MSPEEEQFERESAILRDTNLLSTAAVAVVGDEAGITLFGAALKAWETTHGNEGMLYMAKQALETLIAAEERDSQYN